MKVLTYFTAPWCAPCKRFLPHVIREAEAAGVELQLVNIDTPNGARTAQEHGVTSVPTVLLADEGYVVDRFGVIAPTKLRERLA